MGMTGEYRGYAGICQSFSYILPVRDPERIHIKCSLVFQIDIIVRKKAVM